MKRLIKGFVYPMATHWAETPNGWLKVLGFDDFAFSGVVHALGGAASLAAAYMAGSRKDLLLPDGETIRELPSHSIAVNRQLLTCYSIKKYHNKSSNIFSTVSN